jgi:AraC-like DNA-binding protein/mannose-6-phosphate isomerase-like protein (cupin superfamily)
MDKGGRTLFDVASARLVGVGHVAPDSGWAMPSHSHAYWEFVYFIRGSGKVDVPSATLSPQPFHLVVYPPGLPHAETANPADPEETVFMSIDVTGDPPAGAHLLLPDHNGELGWLLGSFGTTPLAHAYVTAFLHLVERLWGMGVPVRHDSIDTVLQHIHTNYASDISLESLANVACLSKTHLAHVFRSRVGTSPLRYLQHVRIEAAKRLLGTSSLPIREVAARVGFADPLYFSRAFRSATGVSPKACRRQSKSTT